MKQYQRHIPWIFGILLILFFISFFLPEPTDTGEEKEVIFEKETQVELEEREGIEEAMQDSVLPKIHEPRDEIREEVDTVPVVLEKEAKMVVEE